MPDLLSPARNREISLHEQVLVKNMTQDIANHRYDRLRKTLDKIRYFLGTDDALYLFEIALGKVDGWGAALESTLRAIDTPELTGIDIRPVEFIQAIAQKNPETWEDVSAIAVDLAHTLIADQVEKGDTFLLRPELMKESSLAALIPAILEKRRLEERKITIVKYKDGTYDISSLYRTARGFLILSTAGIPPHCSEESKSIAFNLLRQGRIIDADQDVIIKMGKLNDTEYSQIFNICSPIRQNLFLGTMEALDTNLEVTQDGVEKINDLRHPICRTALQNILKFNDHPSLVDAIKGLASIGNDDSTRLLLPHLNTENKDVKIATIHSLGNIGSDLAVPQLEKLAGSSDEEIASSAFLALCKIPAEEAASEAVRIFNQRSVPETINLIPALGNIKQIDVVYPLMDLLFLDFMTFTRRNDIGIYNMVNQAEDQDKEQIRYLMNKIRESVVAAIGNVGEIAVHPLAKAVEILGDIEERKKHSFALGMYATELDKVVMDSESRANDYIRHKDTSVFGSPLPFLIDALGRTRSEEAVEVLAKLARHKEKEIQRRAIEALSEIDLPALNALLALPDDDIDLRTLKIMQIGTISHPRAVEWTIERIKDENEGIRALAMVSVIMRRDPKTLPILEELANDPDEKVRVVLARGLTKTENPIFHPLIEKLRNDPSNNVKDALVHSKISLGETDDDDDIFWA